MVSPNFVLYHSIPNAQHRFVTFWVLESDAHQGFSGCDEKKKCGEAHEFFYSGFPRLIYAQWVCHK